ncbi:ABC transporter ATP-binding protein [Fodinicurvata sp. EGI_FJ10296]|uniref:ABC transporter ATP-binding protein n=1 Tax=Fodinicurvata sp. EGI_FJ10296 TaxID=3231908 RepID=UPI00345224C1
MTNELLLQVRDLSVTLKTKGQHIQAVRNVSFEIAPGGTLALVGESGSGKTMTAMSIIGLTSVNGDIAMSGQALFRGHDLLTLDPAGLRRIRGRRIGTVFQDPAAALNPLMTVGNQIAEAARAADTSRRDRQDIVRNLLGEVGLGGLEGVEQRYPHELSGGQQQRVMIAMALSGNPDLLIADEPTTALDMTVQAQILDLLQRIQKMRGMAILIISHDLGVVSRLAQDVVILRAGAVVERGPVSRILSAPHDAYTRALVACSPTVDTRRPRLPTVDTVDDFPSMAPGPDTMIRAPADEPAILSVRGLTVRYPGRGLLSPPITAVEDVDLTLPRSSIVGIVGESGSGKSTLAKAIVGLVRPQSGRMAFEGQGIRDPGRYSRALRRQIQYVFQDAYGALNPRMSLRQALAEPLDIHGLNAGPDRAPTIARLMDEVGLARGLIDRYPAELSGGQRQRVTIARALALGPDLLICDEIVSALDVSVQAQILNLLSDLQAARGLSLLFISHDLAVVSHLCDRVAVMADGAIIEEGPRHQVFQSPASDITRRLLDAARALEPDATAAATGPAGTGARETVRAVAYA